MKLWVISDLHCETVPFPGAFKPSPPDFDVLVCAGDTWSGSVEKGFAFLRALAGRKPIVTVLGNHEHWRSEVGVTAAAARRAAVAADIRLLEGDAVDLLGVRFIGATLWTDYELGGNVELQRPTGEEIRVHGSDGERPFAVGDARQLHAEARERLGALLALDSPLPRVVVTHHAPLADCVAPSDRGKWIAGNCASDISELTDTGRADLWVHGHIHQSVDLRRQAGTRILCNPAGALFSNPSFDERLTVEIAD